MSCHLASTHDLTVPVKHPRACEYNLPSKTIVYKYVFSQYDVKITIVNKYSNNVNLGIYGGRTKPPRTKPPYFFHG